LIAALMMLVLAFAQAVTVAHACPVPHPGSPWVAQAVQAESTMPADCQEMAKQADSTVNLCLSHCFVDQQVDAQADAPSATVAPRPALLVHLSDPYVPTATAALSLLPIAAAPPPQLRFRRFLI
jgi:hypothetical protein